VLVGLFFFSAFRYEVGCDWSGYLNQYLRAEYGGFEEAFADREPIWWTILTTQHYTDLPYHWVNVVSSAVFFMGFHALALRQHGVNGFLVTTDTVWRDALMMLLRAPDLRSRMGAAGRQMVKEQHSLQGWGPRVADMLSQIAREHIA
jgi:hypothetical protein